MWFRNKETGAEFYVTNEAHRKRLQADPTYEVFESTKKGKKAKKAEQVSSETGTEQATEAGAGSGE